jgi:hypothetical protein
MTTDMNTHYALLVEGHVVYQTDDLDELQKQIDQRELRPGEYSVQEHGSWGAQ